MPLSSCFDFSIFRCEGVGSTVELARNQGVSCPSKAKLYIKHVFVKSDGTGNCICT